MDEEDAVGGLNEGGSPNGGAPNGGAQPGGAPNGGSPNGGSHVGGGGFGGSFAGAPMAGVGGISMAGSGGFGASSGVGGFGASSGFGGSAGNGGFGAVAGSFGGVGGSAGTGGVVQACLAIAGDVCQQCQCKTCSTQIVGCFSDLGCALIFACVQQRGCQGLACYAPQTCKPTIDQFGGLAGDSMSRVFSLLSCAVASQNACGC